MIKKQITISEINNLVNPCKCDLCEHGCKFGSGFLVDDDITKISQFLGITEDDLKQKHLDEIEKFNTKLFRPKLKRYPYGECKFFNKKCEIHEVKPTECRISMGCKDYGEQLSIWFMLNHFVNKHDPESVRQFALYLKSGGKTIEGGKLKDLVGDKSLLAKILNYEILK